MLSGEKQMVLFNRFSKKQNDSETTVDANELIATQKAVDEQAEEVKPKLSIPDDWILKPELHYVYRFENNQLPPLKPNQISISGVQLNKKEDAYEILAFIRHSLQESIILGNTTLLLIDDSGNVLGRKVFNLGELGTLPPCSSRPWTFVFHEKELKTHVIPADGWRIAFELKHQHQLDLPDSWQKSLAQEQIERLDQLVSHLTPPKPGELNFMGLSAVFGEKGDLSVSLLIRNGSQKNIAIQTLPLQVLDAHDKLVASGAFRLESFEVKANTSKPWTFIFPKDLVKIPDPDLSRWKVVVPNKN
jgi:accessory Sec system S-layer assembly protein